MSSRKSKNSWVHSRIIPLDAIPHVKNFKYRGEDRSYIYVYVLSPFADVITDHLPMWLPPNVITLFGSSLNLVAHVVLLYYQGFEMQGPLPAWAVLMTGLFYFIYIMMDNTDRKQARRMHSSSVLGMLFDHGCDGYTSFIITINICKVLQVSNNAFTLLVATVISGSFYFATLESYYIGGVFLPELNAVSDGAVLYFASCVFAVAVGPEWLTTPIAFGLRSSQWCAVLCFAFATVFWSLNVCENFYRQDRVREYNISDVFLAILYISLI